VGFAKTFLTAQMFRVLPRSKRTVFAGDARLGMATAFPRSVLQTDENGRPIVVTVTDLPASERFFAGGDTTVRGFALDQLGTPQTLDKGYPSGGNAVIILNAEIRVPVRGGLGVVGFLDTGNVFANTSDLRLTELRNTLGFGVRYKSPVGPIRVDIGFKTHRNEIAPGVLESRSALHISLGQAF
jgi:outer membrane translocation and assembly module TamA